MAPLRASNVCDDGSFSSPKECALAPSLAEGCCKATREQKEQTTDFVSAGHFWCFLSGKKHVKNFVYKIDNMCSDRSHAAQTEFVPCGSRLAQVVKDLTRIQVNN